MTYASSLQPHLDHQQPLAGATQQPHAAATVGVVGGSGFTGALLAELLLRHPSVRLQQVSSEALAGEPVRKHLPRLRSDLAFCPESAVTGLDLAFVCLPHGEAAPVVERLLDDGARVVDLSADFRLSAADYASWYGAHPCPSLTPGVYGLTELHRDEIRGARLVANPGCYPTAALLALSPLRQIGLLDVVIDAKSGVSGAGKSASGRTHFCAVDSDLVAYGVESHRHYPEILAGLAARLRSPSFRTWYRSNGVSSRRSTFAQARSRCLARLRFAHCSTSSTTASSSSRSATSRRSSRTWRAPTSAACMPPSTNVRTA
jgi:N-acetyl-gamma-glutamyl-phosphate reductase common form